MFVFYLLGCIFLRINSHSSLTIYCVMEVVVVVVVEDVIFLAADSSSLQMSVDFRICNSFLSVCCVFFYGFLHTNARHNPPFNVYTLSS